VNVVDRYAVIGNPVAHSRSPQIHAAFARQTGQDIGYERLLAPLDGFVGVATAFFAQGGAGLNVTVPFKEQAFAWVTEHDEFAGAAGAVNTIVRRDGGFLGCNTDGVGLLADLQDNLGVALADARILLLGAGGAIRGIVGPLLGRAPACVHIRNRTHARARALLQRFEDPRLAVVDDAVAGQTYDVVINGTAAGLAGTLPGIPAGSVVGAMVYDLAYGAAARAFLEWSERAGARRVSDGLGMLVEQAAVAFHLWRGVRPATAPVIAALRSVP
jgi:shikimate dehydrogenase